MIDPNMILCGSIKSTTVLYYYHYSFPTIFKLIIIKPLPSIPITIIPIKLIIIHQLNFKFTNFLNYQFIQILFFPIPFTIHYNPPIITINKQNPVTVAMLEFAAMSNQIVTANDNYP